MSSEIPLCLQIPDAARLLGVSRQTVYRQIAAGNLPLIKFGRRSVIPAASIRALVERLSQVSIAA